MGRGQRQGLSVDGRGKPGRGEVGEMKKEEGREMGQNIE